MKSTTPNAEAAKSAIRQVGLEFRRLRGVRGERLEDIATQLDIKVTYLFGIEQGDLSVLPSRDEAKSMICSYANYLGLDGETIGRPMDPIMSSLDSEIAPKDTPTTRNFDRTSAIILASSVVLGIGVGWTQIGNINQFSLVSSSVTADAISPDAAVDDENGGTDIVGGEDDQQIGGDGVTELPAATVEALLSELKTFENPEAISVSLEPTVDVAALQEEQGNAAKEEDPANVLAALVAQRGDGAYIYEPENTDARVILRALTDILVQVTSRSRDYVWTETMKPREMLLVPNRDDLELWIGDAASIEVLLDGEVMPPLGPPSTAISGLSLAVSSLEALSEVASSAGAKPTF